MNVHATNIFGGRLDRLSSLIERFRVQADLVAPDEAEVRGANFVVLRGADDALRLVFVPNGSGDCAACDHFSVEESETLVVAAKIEIAGAGHHLVLALPRCISVALVDAPDLRTVVSPLVEEVVQPRCGGQAVFHRLAEVVVIRLLRHALESDAADVGLLAGLSHPRLAAALVAMHERPGVAWNLESLAAEAGMSRTQFAVTFKEVLGMTPGAYMSNWRLDIARAELESGVQVRAVARMCGFASAAAFSRAFARRYGHAPKLERRKAL
ncbi:helix-turn-helix domain-containing protein [Roseibium sp.]|uniref:helix-turn-helix transcriptional regulator n=1 Tax=Roseibium sp. TaxID=1936156 RepID=UPI003263AD11